MQILFQHFFEHPVWRLIPSLSEEKTWAVELRNSAAKQVSYFFINSLFSITELKTDLDWWSGVEAVSGQYIIFHGYLQHDLPLHQGIKVFDAFRNTWLWDNEFASFSSANGKTLEAKLTIGSLETKLMLNIETGNEINPPSRHKDTTLESQIVLLTEDDPYFNDISEFVSKYTPYKAIRFFEYLETTNYIVVSYYVQNKKLMDNYLLISNLNGEEELHLCLTEGTKGVAAGTFHVSNSLLSFVKDRNELFIIEIN